MKPLIDLELKIEKMVGKGGWHYVIIPGVKTERKNKFGWLRVKGFVDSYELSQYKLMPFKSGNLFLPIKADIRKKINKTEGDTVKITLYLDETPFEITQELLDCFDMENPELLKTFKSFSESNQQYYIDWIYDAKTEVTKANRIAQMMERLEKGQKFYDPK